MKTREGVGRKGSSAHLCETEERVGVLAYGLERGRAELDKGLREERRGGSTEHVDHLPRELEGHRRLERDGSAWGAPEHEPKVDVHQPPLAVQQHVAVVPVLKSGRGTEEAG